MPPFLALVALAAVFAADVSSAESLADRERAVADAVSSLRRLAEVREGRRAEAAVLAEEIEKAKQRGASVRADRALEGRLRSFDRLAAALDELDAGLERRRADVARARRAFDTEADATAERSAAASPLERARRLADLDAARERVRALSETPSPFRPPLLVVLEPADGPGEIEGKLLLLEAERSRFGGELEGLASDERLLAARIRAKRELAQELSAARRSAGTGLTLLAREADELARALTRLTAEHEALVRERDQRRQALQQVDAAMSEMKAKASGIPAPEAR